MGHLDPYLGILESVRGVRRVDLVPEGRALLPVDARLTIQTDAGKKVTLLAEEFRSHLSHDIVDHVIARAARIRGPLLILAPHIGSGIASKVADAGLNYLDRHGNCHIAVGSFYVHIEGRTAPAQSSAEKGMRSPAFQVLFTYLASPDLLDAPVRTVAESAGVSRQPPSDMRQRLLEEGYIFKSTKGYRWVERRRDDALNLWLRGYQATVRPSLVWGTFRTKSNPGELEDRIASTFPSIGIGDYRWGGTTAAYRFTGHYRGPKTTVHVHSAPADLGQRLRGLPDPNGNLIVMDSFGTINWPPDTDTVHPLLVYSEMLRDGDERAREAAEGLFEKHIRPAWTS